MEAVVKPAYVDSTQDAVWSDLRAEVALIAQVEESLRVFLETVVLGQSSFEASLAELMAGKLSSDAVSHMNVRDVVADVYQNAPFLGVASRRDLAAALERDPACSGYAKPYLYHKGFHALQAHCVSHWLWEQGRRALASYFQSRSSEIFAVDIHPGARIGSGVFIDHATSIVIGETAIVDDEVSMMQEVTLGGTGKEQGDRHPKVGRGVLLCAGAKLLGNIRIGAGSKVGAGSVVLADVPENATVVGVPAKVASRSDIPQNPALTMR